MRTNADNRKEGDGAPFVRWDSSCHLSACPLCVPSLIAVSSLCILPGLLGGEAGCGHQGSHPGQGSGLLVPQGAQLPGGEWQEQGQEAQCDAANDTMK